MNKCETVIVPTVECMFGVIKLETEIRSAY